MSAITASPNVAGLTQAKSSSVLASSQRLAGQLNPAAHSPTPGLNASPGDQSELHKNFNAFVGQSFYGMLMQQMHKTVGKAPYMNGGRAEQAFQGQLDQVMSEKMAQADGGKFSDAMYNLFNMQMQAK